MANSQLKVDDVFPFYTLYLPLYDRSYDDIPLETELICSVMC